MDEIKLMPNTSAVSTRAMIRAELEKMRRELLAEIKEMLMPSAKANKQKPKSE